MIKEDFYRDLQIFTKTSEFAEIRKYSYGRYLHSGDDFISDEGKNQNIYNLIDGVFFSSGTGRDYGNFIIIKHNPKFIRGGIDDIFFSLYCHLDLVDYTKKKVINNFIGSGSIIGKMGNTGNCYTLNQMTNKYRPVTEKEAIDPKCNKGVHLHQGFYQSCEINKETKLLKELKKLKLVADNPYNYFYQWGKLFYNPKKIMTYFKLLQGRSI